MGNGEYGCKIFEHFLSVLNTCNSSTDCSITSIKITSASGSVMQDVVNDKKTDGNETMTFDGFGLKLKRIAFDCYCLCDDNLTKDDIDNFLQIIAPLSPKEIELKKRLKSEITDEMRQLKQSWQIDKLTKQIENEIDFKYNNPIFDENELYPLVEEDIDKYKCNNNYKWQPSLEMLSFNNCSTEVDDHDYDETTNWYLRGYCQRSLNDVRIKSSLCNLRGLAIKSVSIDEKERVFGCIAGLLLNSLTNQLESLHIDNTVIGILAWVFVDKKYPRTNSSREKSWFPANVQELCVCFKRSTDDKANNANTFWHYVNVETFPKLKKFKIVDMVNNDFCQKIHSKNEELIENLGGLIVNGLESLQLKIRNLDLRDLMKQIKNGTYFETRPYSIQIDTILRLIADTLFCAYNGNHGACDNKKHGRRGRGKNSKSNSYCWIKRQDFILKIELDLNARDEEKDVKELFKAKLKTKGLEKIDSELLTIVTWFSAMFKNFMFGFKLTIRHIDKEIDKLIFGMLQRAIQRHAVYQSTPNCIVEKQIKYNHSKTKIMLVSVFKSGNQGECGISSQFCNMEPKFEFECNDCRCVPWTEF